jgi:thiosulfate reductase cytochrome b subunit
VRNLDRDPGFWLVVAILVPLMLVVELACRVDDVLAALRRRRR